MERRADAKLGRHLLVVLLFRLVRVPGPELLDGEDGPIVLAPHQPHRTAGPRPKHLAELAVLGREAVIVAEGELLAGAQPWRGLGGGLYGCRGCVSLLVAAACRFPEEALQVGHGAVLLTASGASVADMPVTASFGPKQARGAPLCQAGPGSARRTTLLLAREDEPGVDGMSVGVLLLRGSPALCIGIVCVATGGDGLGVKVRGRAARGA